jgi:hypothetical protein
MRLSEISHLNYYLHPEGYGYKLKKRLPVSGSLWGLLSVAEQGFYYI